MSESTFSIRNGAITFNKDDVFPEDTVVTCEVKTPGTPDSYGNIQYEFICKVNRMQVKSIIVRSPSKVFGNHSANGTSVSFCGTETTPYIQFYMKICKALEDATTKMAERGVLPRAYCSPFDKNGVVYKAKNEKHRATLAKDGKTVEDAKIYYGISANVYSIQCGLDKAVKFKINRRGNRGVTTVISDNDGFALDHKVVKTYLSIIKQLNASNKPADKYSAATFSNYYGKEAWAAILNHYKVIKAKAPTASESKEALSKYGRIPYITELSEIMKPMNADRFVVKLPTKISDSNKNPLSMTFKPIVDAITLSDAVDLTAQAIEEDEREYERQLQAEAEGDDDNMPPPTF